MAEILIDVRELAPPAPLEKILSALDTVGPGNHLKVLHRREPCMLYPMLERKGFAYRLLKRNEHLYEITIWRAGEEPQVKGESDS